MAAWPVLALLGYQIFIPILSDTVKVSEGGYEDIVIAINPAVPENPTVIEKIQLMIKEATQDLFDATKKRVFIRSIKILIPSTWSQQEQYGIRSRERYEQAQVIIADTYLDIGDSPYTKQHGGCGEKGRYIHLTPNFLLDEGLISVYGSLGKVFVHEWAHLRWGVFEEYSSDQPFYISANMEVQATRCTASISGIYRVPHQAEESCVTIPCKLDPDTGLYGPSCAFFPERNQNAAESIMYYPALQSISGFCSDITHNMEAPTMQNRMCNCRSTWEIIEKSSDITLTPPTDDIAIPEPVISILRYRDRVITLLLDVSGSMAGNNRLWRVHQAADVFLNQAIANGTYVSVVEYSSYGFALCHLTKIRGSPDREALTLALPTTVASESGSYFCSGIRVAFEENKGPYRSLNGTEVILLADGTDHTKTSQCFSDITRSGAIIHVVALSWEAAEVLEDIADMTGGLNHFATDNLESNDLIDAFVGIANENGDPSSRVYQLISDSLTVETGRCHAGSVLIDSTVGEETFFTVTWQSAKPSIQLEDPEGKLYSIGSFSTYNNSHLSRLRIPGLAKNGDWAYEVCNSFASSQVFGLVVTSRAADPLLPPITVEVFMNTDTNRFPTPMSVYASISRGLLPVTGAKVTATITPERGTPISLKLLDNGAGADIAKDDGIYSRYFFTFPVNGRYGVRVRAEGEDGQCRVAYPRGRAHHVQGFTENGKVVMKPSNPLDKQTLPEVGRFRRTITGGSFLVSGVGGVNLHPPGKITDLEAHSKENRVTLSWTATGGELDQGTAQSYELRMNKNIRELRDNFEGSTLVDTSTLIPSQAGTRETFRFDVNPDNGNGAVLYFAIMAINENFEKSPPSNIAQAALLPPLDSTAQPATKCPSPKPRPCTTTKYIQACEPASTPRPPTRCPPKTIPKCTTPRQATQDEP
ncbi:calcium-activated chloride channel regulator 1-like [Hyperolius riggenbachi]|uniref:calcium-activated chloride channel regulator 1-like n=1 Tax=Hyperolius riggenbachi TaxID=752182 RepID=UPI0035A2624C